MQSTSTHTARISHRIGSIEESATLAVDATAKALKAAGEDVIGFGAGEPDFPTPEHVVAAAAEAGVDPTLGRHDQHRRLDLRPIGAEAVQLGLARVWTHTTTLRMPAR